MEATEQTVSAPLLITASIDGQADITDFDNLDIIITTYETLLSEHKHNCKPTFAAKKRTALFNTSFRRLVLDKGERIKKHMNKDIVACFAVDAACRWVSTDLPVHEEEEYLYSLIHFLRIKPYNAVQAEAAAYIRASTLSKSTSKVFIEGPQGEAQRGNCPSEAALKTVTNMDESLKDA